MTVQGEEIPQAIQDACLKRAKTTVFKAAAIAETAINAGLTTTHKRFGNSKEHIALRLADRLIQTWRKKGLITLCNKNMWKYDAST